MKIAIVGGCGHVGLPLGITLADAGIRTVAFDISFKAVEMVSRGVMPFKETDAEEILIRTLSSGLFSASSDPAVIRDADVIIVVIGTPVNEHLNPDPNEVVTALQECVPFMNSNQLVILRSTIFPGVTKRVEYMLRAESLDVDVVFCPERIAEGHAIKELRELPQIVGSRSAKATDRATELFEALGVKTIEVTPEEAELAKLFTNTWRYIKFAAANQFWLMANEAGLDYSKIREAITFEYPRAIDLPGAGFAAGPCLFKDTMQLAAFSNNNFSLGYSAMLINEGQPKYVVDRLASEFDLDNLTVGILGMAFKGESDDTRSSLSYKLKGILRFCAKEVLTTDPYVTTDDSLLPVEVVLNRADLLIIGAPHQEYRNVEINKPVFDIWNLRGGGSQI